MAQQGGEGVDGGKAQANQLNGAPGTQIEAEQQQKQAEEPEKVAPPRKVFVPRPPPGPPPEFLARQKVQASLIQERLLGKVKVAYPSMNPEAQGGLKTKYRGLSRLVDYGSDSD
jgi:hypothetical protein